MNDNDPPGPSHSEMDATGEAIAGKPLPMSPHQGIAYMKARISELQQSALGLAWEDSGDLADHTARVNREIQTCRDRLLEYELLLQSDN